MWMVATIGGLLALATGLVSLHSAGDVFAQIGPVLAFLIGITVIAELADNAGVFAAAARIAARLGGGSVRRLFVLVVVLGTLTTLFLSLDTTAVLLTPVVLTLAVQLEISPIPFAMVTVWLANTASLLLPVSNLTNLLAIRSLGLSASSFAARMWAPAIASLVVTVVVLAVWHRRELCGHYRVPEQVAPEDPVLFWSSVAVCVAVGPLFVAGANVAVVACAGAFLLSIPFFVRRPGVLQFRALPWRLVLMVAGLFVVVRAWQEHGLHRILVDAAGTSASGFGLVRMAGVATVTSNIANNLPAFAALQSAADTTSRTLALLIGTNVGALVTLWGSLATLLWRDRCRAAGVTIGAKRFGAVGLVGVPVLVVASVAALATIG